MRSSRARFYVAGILMLMLFAAAASANPSQSDVFKSIQNSVEEKPTFGSMSAYLLAAGGAVLFGLMIYLGQRQQRVTAPPRQVKLNHPGKLSKELSRQISLKPVEMKQLKILADAVHRQLDEEISPLALLLCPSLLAKGVQANAPKVDRKIVAMLVRKMRLNEK